MSLTWSNKPLQPTAAGLSVYFGGERLAVAGSVGAWLPASVAELDRSASSRAIANQHPNPNMKTKPCTKGLLSLTVVLAFLIPAVTEADSKVTFDNQSGKPALVKLAGPTASSVTVENNKKESVSVAAGHYFIKVRYGTPEAYSYSKGDEFDVTETATAVSDITITLHKVVAGNYGSKAISETEFGEDGRVEKKAGVTATPDSVGATEPGQQRKWQSDWKEFTVDYPKTEAQESETIKFMEKDVVWKGRVKKVSPPNEGAKTGAVEIEMDPPLRLGEFSTDTVSLTPSEEDWGAWAKVQTPQQVTFQTRLTSFVPWVKSPVMVFTMNDGSKFAKVSTAGGKLVKINSESK